MSKRHGATSITEFQTQGYLPKAMVNFLALLGWSLDDRTELISRENLVRHFSLERIGKAAAIFSYEKLEWMNGVYIRQLSLDEFARRAIPFLEKGLPPQVMRPLTRDYVHRLAPLIQERAKTLGEVSHLADFFFLDKLKYESDLLLETKLSPEMAIRALEITRDRIGVLESFDAVSLEPLLRSLAKELGLKTGEFFGLLRVAVTGRTASPPLFQTMAVLGKERCLKRIEGAIGKLQKSD